MAVAHSVLHEHERKSVMPAKTVSYYESDRSPLLAWIGGRWSRVLDIGCGAGANGAWLRRSGSSTIVGVEIDPYSSELASRHYNHVHNEPIESALPKVTGSFDLVLCADVLEHLVDPWTVLRQLQRLSTDETRLAVSIPNIRYVGALWRIAVRGGFAYEEEGIFDRTHLRFFTRGNLDEMLRTAGWEPERWGRGLRSRRMRVVSKLTLGRADEWLSYQWYVVARRRRSPDGIVPSG